MTSSRWRLRFSTGTFLPQRPRAAHPVLLLVGGKPWPTGAPQLINGKLQVPPSSLTASHRCLLPPTCRQHLQIIIFYTS
uniref:Uncharacterized protein n=1 Tax=Arundo donax TaxID=35708 RepID=A0A0A9APG1_ARUDO